jgi:acyl carrier protein
MDDIKKIVTTFVKKKNKKISEDSNLFLNNILDSFGVIEIVSLIEKKFGIKFHPNDLNTKNFSSIKKIVNLIKKNERFKSKKSNKKI